MPSKKRDLKTEEPAVIEENAIFIHEGECARYSGGIRRYPVKETITTGRDKKNVVAATAAVAEQPLSVLVQRHGHGTYVSPTMRYVGDWVEDVMEGYGHLEMTLTGSSYDGRFVKGKFDGLGTYCWRDGSRYEGSWRSNRMHGDGVFTDVDGTVWRGKFYNGTGPGLAKIYQQTSTLALPSATMAGSPPEEVGEQSDAPSPAC